MDCTHCGNWFTGSPVYGPTKCGRCTTMQEWAELATRVLADHGGRGDSVRATIHMWADTAAPFNVVRYAVRELGGSIGTLTLCLAHDALYAYDGVSVESGVSHEGIRADYSTETTITGACDTCQEWAGPSGEFARFYWDGIDHETLHCACGTPSPEQLFDESRPGVAMRRCTQCGAVATLDEGTGEWDILG